MSTSKNDERTVLDLLNSLISLDYDAIEAYKAAISRVDAITDRGRLASFLQDHERHVTELSAIVTASGGRPPTAGDLMQILTKGKVVIGGLMGDRIVLAAMKDNEDDTNTAYERALLHPDLPASTREVLQRNLIDERAHRVWLERRIAESEGLVDLKKAS